MSGRDRGSSFGQLALMDAVVFFVIAIAISSMMFYYAREEAIHAPSMRPEGQSDPEAVLRVFLRASLGEEIVLDLDREIHVSANSEIAECLQIELDALTLGAAVSDFAPMNERLSEILEATCSAVMDPYLVSLQLLSEGDKWMFSLPCEPPDSSTRYASSTELAGADGSTYLLMLVLVPASLPKILHVGAGDFDLGPRVCRTPAHFDP